MGKREERTKQKTISILVRYQGDLKHITGKSRETVRMPLGATSADFINRLRERHPQLFKAHIPGRLGFERNGEVPHAKDVLQNKDRYEFCSWSEGEIQAHEEREMMEALGFKYVGTVGEESTSPMPEHIDCTWRRVPCGKWTCAICGKLQQEKEQQMMKGEDPESVESAYDDMSNNVKEALMSLKREAKRLGIDITAISEDMVEPPKPEKFPLYRRVAKWHAIVSDIEKSDAWQTSPWIYTEAAADLMWYKNVLLLKVERQVETAWEFERGYAYGEHDLRYTHYVLQECLASIRNALVELAACNTPEQKKLRMVHKQLDTLEPDILAIWSSDTR